MNVLLVKGYMYLPYIAHLIFIIGVGLLFSRAMSVYTGMLLLGFLLPFLAYIDDLRPLAYQLSLASHVLKVVGIFGYVRSLHVQPAAAQT